MVEMKVYVVTYFYDYEGEGIGGVYATRKAANRHPPKGGDVTIISEMEVLDWPKGEKKP
jgi:hypothetical protein